MINKIHKYITDDKTWIFISLSLMIWYISPLFYSTFYIPTFDNLDSTIVWYKILAHSDKIFASNDTIIPNMMNGLPRSSYGSEFNIILLLYYIFTPKVAFIINEIIIHTVAFFAMYIFLKRYIVPYHPYYKKTPIYIGALYFALLPYWSGAGLSIPLLPLVTYSLLNIKYHKDTKLDWIFLAILPLYSSFVFLYIFYISFAGIYWLYDSIYHKKVNIRLFCAIFMMGVVFLLKDYRLIMSMFVDQNFISHRVEFDIFFKENLWESYRLALVNFIQGHVPHSQSFQQVFVLPIALIALMLTLVKKRFSSKESLIIWSAILLSFIANFWDIILIHKFTLPGIALLAIAIYIMKKRYRTLPLLILFIIVLSICGACFEYEGFHFLTEKFPIFKTLNMIRMTFVEPFVYTTILVLAFLIFIRKLKFTIFFSILFIAIVFKYDMKHSFYQTKPQDGYASFENYYVPDLFEQLKENLKKKDKDFDIHKSHFVSFGIEPAVALYNNLYTVDGYSVNYPLSYKYAFRKVFAPFHTSHLYDIWGSKVYITSILTDKKYYKKNLKIKRLRFDTDALCKLHTNYVLSPYLFDDPSYKDRVKLITSAKGDKDSWDLYLYKLICK